MDYNKFRMKCYKHWFCILHYNYVYGYSKIQMDITVTFQGISFKQRNIDKWMNFVTIRKCNVKIFSLLEMNKKYCCHHIPIKFRPGEQEQPYQDQPFIRYKNEQKSHPYFLILKFWPNQYLTALVRHISYSLPKLQYSLTFAMQWLWMILYTYY